MDVLAHHLHSAPESPSVRLNAPVERDLEKVLLACLAKRPADRPASAQVLRDRLRACRAARLWTNRRAAEWWTLHRHQLRSALPAAKGSIDVSESHLIVTRMADQSSRPSDVS